LKMRPWHRARVDLSLFGVEPYFRDDAVMVL
jgi:hypothetical protein